MDPFKLLSRSVRQDKHAESQKSSITPSAGQTVNSQLFPNGPQASSSPSRERKRGQGASSSFEAVTDGLDFFGKAPTKTAPVDTASRHGGHVDKTSIEPPSSTSDPTVSISTPMSMADDERKSLLKQHKLKLTYLNLPSQLEKRRRKKRDKDTDNQRKHEKLQVFPELCLSFRELQSRFSVSSRLAENINNEGYTIPTEVQLGSLPLLLDAGKAAPDLLLASEDSTGNSTLGIDLLTVAPTGSGKTLAYLIPTMQAILTLKHRTSTELSQQWSGPQAVVVVPTKELAGQIVNEARKLAKGTGLNVTQVRKDMQFAAYGRIVASSRNNVEKDAESYPEAGKVKADLLVSTPGTILSVMQNHTDDVVALPSVRHLILDEADVLLDPLFREQTLTIWNGLTSPALRVSLWSATMGSNIETLTQVTINARRERFSFTEAPLIRLVVGLKDSAVPNIQHRLIYAASEQGKLMGLRQLLHPSSTSAEAGPALNPPFLVFTQTIERAVALHSELLYDIPAEAGGISRIAVLHADLSDNARDNVMARFRKGEIWVLITTDLLSRGVDFRGINGVVNYDISSSSAAYVHRVGRTGRAGREGCVAVTLYTKEDIPYVKHVANVIAISMRNSGKVQDEAGDETMPKWLLDSLPKASKKEKKELKRHGVEARARRDGREAKKSRISTKSGYVRRIENNRKAAVAASKNQQGATEDTGEQTDFGGFD